MGRICGSSLSPVNSSQAAPHTGRGICGQVGQQCERAKGYLVQQQQVGALHADHGEDQARLLPLAQLPNLGRLLEQEQAVRIL